jgi:hypothetical protein
MQRTVTLRLVIVVVSAILVLNLEAQAGVLMGLWKMEENAPTQTAVDSAAKGLTGRYNTGVVPNVPGASGFGLGTDFGNSSASITLSDPTYSISQLRNNFSVEAWINPSVVNVRQRIFSNDSWGFGISGTQSGGKGTLLLTTYGVLDYVGNVGVLPAGTWSHVAAVMDSNNQVTFYVNGNPAGGATNANPGNATNSVSFIGGRIATGSGEPFRGKADEVALFSGTLTQAEIQGHMTAGVPNPKQTVFRYDYSSLEPLSGIVDDSGAGHPGHTQGTTSYSTNIPRGFPTTLLPGGIPAGSGDRSLNGGAGQGMLTDQIDLVDNAKIAAAGGVTFETWIYRTQDANAGLEKVIDIGGTYGFRLVSNSSPTTDNDDFYFVPASGSVKLPVGQWHHVAGVLDTLGRQVDGNGDLSVMARFFFDGQQIGTDTATSLTAAYHDLWSKQRPIGIGVHPTVAGEIFRGLFYDTRIVLGALSPGEFSLTVPEPGSWLLFGFGSLTLWLLRRRAA